MIPFTLQPIPESFTDQLVYYSQSKFTGRLEIKVPTGEKWTLYLHLGRLAWATGGRHSVRRWQRHLLHFFPGVNPRQLIGRQNEQPECWEYHALGLLALRNTPRLEQLGGVVEEIINEVLFDLMSAIAIAAVNHASARLNVSPEASDVESEEEPPPSFAIASIQGLRPSKSGMLPHLLMIPIETAIKRAQTEWQNWIAAGLTHCSPDLAPVLTDALALQNKTVSQVYQNLSMIIDGKHTLRDLAVMTDRDVLVVTRSLLPYVRQQFVKFVQISDLPHPRPTASQVAIAKSLKTPPRRSSHPLIAAIDDDPQILASLEDVLSSTGCRFLGIPDPVQALPTLIQYKPDLIFLDLAMPIANGYEICAQIRRVTHFHDVPVVILTENNGLLDLMRSKVVGATNFLSKPITTNKVLSTLHKYCSHCSIISL